ncbi:MAG: extracellular solute-binding protein [Desulfobacterales bacterium]|nr:extracellular solute-binding protein [Desulfobacterales bacterium]
MKTNIKLLSIASLVFALVLFAMAPVKIGAAENVTLRMLVWEGYTPDELCDAFKQLMAKEHNVNLTLDIKYVASNDDFFKALRDGNTDIVAPSHNVPKDKRWHLIKNGLVLPLNLDNIPNYKNILPALQKAEYCTSNGEVFAVPHVMGPYGLAYNTTIIPTPPDSWNVFWDEKYAGKYSIGMNQYEHNVSLAALAMGLPKDKIYDIKTLMSTPGLKEKLAQLAVNAGAMWQGVDDPDTLKGKSFAAVWGFSLPQLKQMGEEWRIAEPKEGTTGWVDNFMISHTLKDKPKERQIAEAWLNFVLGDEYQVYDVRGLACSPVTTTVTHKLTPEEISMLHLDDPEHFEKNRILWEVLDQRQRNGIRMLWNKALSQRK